jgi:ubiquinone/menaquinone biosynthesis C-methylase UbiE
MNQATPTRSSKEQFDKQAEQYNAQWNSWSAETLQWMIDNADVTPNCPVLDVATGGGFTAIEFAKRAKSVVGTDVSTGMLAEARKRAEAAGVGNATFEEAAAEALPFDDETFGIVTCRIAAHHFLDVAGFVREAARVLKPGGRFVLVDTTVPDDDPDAAAWQNAVEAVRDPSHVRNYSPREWVEMVSSAGLAVIAATAAGSGITIPLEDWIAKAGCTADQADEVRRRFASAPDSVKETFHLQATGDGTQIFQWQRLLLKAKKPK